MNTEYGMYISLEERDLARKRALMKKVSGILQPRANRHFRDCKPHLGSFLVKVPGQDSYTYPHQDWTFVDSPPFVSITVWIALVDTEVNNGALGFVKGSQWFFDRPIGSPSPPFGTCTQGHEALLYEYLEFVPLKRGEAVAFDNRTIHGAAPNLSATPRLAVAIGMTPREAPLFHYFLVSKGSQGNHRTLMKLRVNDDFFEHYSVTALKEVFDADQLPGRCEVAETLQDEFLGYSGDEIRQLCEQAGLRKNGLHLGRHGSSDRGGGSKGRTATRVAAAVGSLWKTLFRS
jgi:hypothetical protein